MSQTDQDKATAAHGKIVARAWRDAAFKAKLLADPHATLTEAGVAVPEGVTVKVVENTDSHFHLVLPPKPTGELSDEALDKVAGGTLFSRRLSGFRADVFFRRLHAIGHWLVGPLTDPIRLSGCV